MKFMSEAWMKVHFLWRSLQYLTAKETAQYILTFYIFYFYRLPIDCVEGSSSTPSGFAIGLNECHPECWPVFQLFWRSTNISHSRKLNFEFIHSVYWFVVYRFSQSAASCRYQPIWIFSLHLLSVSLTVNSSDCIIYLFWALRKECFQVIVKA